jgi:small-conductance mechanosensitive channel
VVSFLDTIIFGNPLAVWLQAVLFFLGMFLLLALGKLFLGGRKKKDAKEAQYSAGLLFRTLVRKFSWLSVVIICLNMARIPLEIPNKFSNEILAVNTIALILQIGLWVNAVILLFVQFRIKTVEEESDKGETSVRLLGLIARVVLWTILALMILDNVPGIQIDSLIASLGITGIAVALAVQSILGDLFASITIALDKPFNTGDYIAVDDKSGTVERIGLRSTEIRAVSGEVIVVSNKKLLDSWVNNYDAMVNRRVSFNLRVTYQTAYEKLHRVPEILEEIITSFEKTRFDRVTFNDYGESALVFEVVYFIITSDFNTHIDLRHRINLAIFRRFEEEGIDFAYPTRNVYLKK